MQSVQSLVILRKVFRPSAEELFYETLKQALEGCGAQRCHNTPDMQTIV